MCGINGLLNYPAQCALAPAIQGMNQTLVHRGPDDQGQWLDEQHNIALGHQRLAIIDLSPSGQQPMQSASGRYMMVFNGEIYNHRQLRLELENHNVRDWRGHSDSETLLAGFAHWGIQAMLQRCHGMFAIALWDRQQQQLHLMRDRVGEKPLYYGKLGSCFAFSSELKALRGLPIFQQSVNRDALDAYLHYGYIPAPQSIYRGIQKLEPGTLLSLDYTAYRQQQNDSEAISIRQWWSLIATAQQAQQHPIQDEQEAKERLRQQLQHSVNQQSIADVNVGAFLSGGIDSTTIVNQLCKTTDPQKVKTFTVGFNQPGYNEAEQAAVIAKHLGTSHEAIYVDVAEAQAVIPQLAHIYDEPFADTSQIPTYLIARHARQHVTVALSGDGGDELFGGYSSYLHSPTIWSKVRHLPLPLRNGVAKLLTGIRPQHWDFVAKQLNSSKLSANNIHKLGNSLHGCQTLADFFIRLGLQLPEHESWVIGSSAHERISPPSMQVCDLHSNAPEKTSLSSMQVCDLHSNAPEKTSLPSMQVCDLHNNSFQAIRLPKAIWQAFTAEPEHAMMLSDSVNGMPDDILCKVDRAAMAVGLETRIPLLDHKLIELAWRMPLSMKIRTGQGKYLLRQLLYEDIPPALIERPKQGFNVPLAQWLRGELRDWAEDLLDEQRLRAEGYLDAGKVRHCWQQFLSGRQANQQLLWHILMFQAWLERWHSSQ